LFSLPLLTEAFQRLQIFQSFIDHFPLNDINKTDGLPWGKFLSI
jgi:hypothetical protein